jgi:leucyl aminopeptidase
MVDIATLTGAIIVSLGSVRIGVFGNNQEWIDQVVQTGNDGGERMWPFPMDDDYGDQLKSTFADMMNVGGKEAGSITAAKFLSEFTEGVPWVHLDIAGSYRMVSDKGWHVKGSTGGPVRTLINLALADSG